MKLSRSLSHGGSQVPRDHAQRIPGVHESSKHRIWEIHALQNISDARPSNTPRKPDEPRHATATAAAPPPKAQGQVLLLERRASCEQASSSNSSPGSGGSSGISVRGGIGNGSAISPGRVGAGSRGQAAVAAGSRAFGPQDWLYNSKAASISDISTRKAFGSLLAAALPLLQTYDIRSPEGRTPNLRKNTMIIEPCLTARAAALEAICRLPRLEATEDELLEQRLTLVMQRAEAEGPQPVDDELWTQKLRNNHSHLDFMKRLAAAAAAARLKQQQLEPSLASLALALQPPAASGQRRPRAADPGLIEPPSDSWQRDKEQQEQQLNYQIGITDDWLQCRNILEAFANDLPAPAAAALFKRLATLLSSPRARSAMSPTEGREFQTFCSLACLEMADCSQLVEALVARAGQLMSDLLRPPLSAAPSAAAGRWPPAGSARPLSSGVGAPARGRQAAGTGSQEEGEREMEGARSHWAERGAASLGGQGAGAEFSAADYSGLVWGLATLRHRPPDEWLDALCSCCLDRLPRFQPSQLWGLVWGLARLGHVPREAWMERALMCAERIMAEFTVEGMSHLLWALGAMRYVPEKTWLRTFIGQLSQKYRSLYPTQMTQLLEGLAALGYKPREQVCWALQAHAGRNLHAFSAEQQATVLRAIAMHSRWLPQRQFLYDFVTHSKPKLEAMTAVQLSGVLWAFARFKYLPDRSYVRPLLSHLGQRLGAADMPSGPTLSQSIWAIATLAIMPNPRFFEVWMLKARLSLPRFTPQCIAHTLWALPRLRIGPDEGRPLQPDAELLEGLLLRSNQELSSLTGMELSMVIAGLAELRYRPSNAWLSAFTDQLLQRLPTLQNQDYGLALAALAELAAPLDEAWLQALARSAGSKWWSMDLDGMALLLSGFAAYGHRPDSREWWAGFWRESEARWEAAGANAGSPRTLALLLLAVGELVEAAPSRGWQRCLMRAIRLSFPKPAVSTAIPAMLLKAAGREDDEQLPQPQWLQEFLVELREQWGFVRKL